MYVQSHRLTATKIVVVRAATSHRVCVSGNNREHYLLDTVSAKVWGSNAERQLQGHIYRTPQSRVLLDEPLVVGESRPTTLLVADPRTALAVTAD